MPSTDDRFILSNTGLALSTEMDTHLCNGKSQQLTPQDNLDEYAEKWQISITSEEFARKLDEIDPLRHVREEFYYPKKGTLPKSIFKYIYRKFPNIKFNLYI